MGITLTFRQCFVRWAIVILLVVVIVRIGGVIMFSVCTMIGSGIVIFRKDATSRMMVSTTRSRINLGVVTIIVRKWSIIRILLLIIMIIITHRKTIATITMVVIVGVVIVIGIASMIRRVGREIGWRRGGRAIEGMAAATVVVDDAQFLLRMSRRQGIGRRRMIQIGIVIAIVVVSRSVVRSRS